MLKWIKDNGQEIETNDRKETIEYCESLGWERGESDVITGPDIDTIAKQVYDAKRKQLKAAGNESLPIWSKASDDQRQSSREVVEQLMENPDLTEGYEPLMIETARAGLTELVK